MRVDIFKVVPVVGDTIIRAKYARDARLHVCKVIGETRNGDPKVEYYDKLLGGRFIKRTSYGIYGYVPGDFMVVEGIQL